jgi:hypothetical protein
MALFPFHNYYNPWAIMQSSKKEDTIPQQYVGVTYDGSIKHYYAREPLGTGIVLHREDGPAFIFKTGKEFWYYKGLEIKCNNLEDFQRIIKLKAFL